MCKQTNEEIQKMYDDCVVTPSYADVVIHFTDDEENPIETTICFNGKAKSLSDERIFYYAKDFNEFMDLVNGSRDDEFEIDEVSDIF